MGQPRGNEYFVLITNGSMTQTKTRRFLERIKQAQAVVAAGKKRNVEK